MKMLLDHKARLALIGAVRFQLAAWQAKSPEAMSENDYADLQNDMYYLGSLLTWLESGETAG